jgi:hypothetical protein
MKNIFLLPTDKPNVGSLVKYKDGVLGIIKELMENNHFKVDIPLEGISVENNNTVEVFNLYIISDEEIKEGDYSITLPIKEWTRPIKRCVENSYDLTINDKKIILTTDPIKIANGIQEIDDTFLEWFCQNPTCEFVDILKDKCLDTSLMCDCVDEPCRNKGYKIIIPQEKPKQETKEEDCKFDEYVAWNSAIKLFEEIEGYKPNINNRQHELIISSLQQGIIYGYNLKK